MKNKDIYFSIAEKEIISWMIRQAGITEIEAIDHVLKQKRELAYIHGQRGNLELQRQILKEINEWSEDDESNYNQIVSKEQNFYIPS